MFASTVKDPPLGSFSWASLVASRAAYSMRSIPPLISFNLRFLISVCSAVDSWRVVSTGNELIKSDLIW